MFNVVLYNFNKKPNSTARPPASLSGVTMSCVMKTASSVITPILEISDPQLRNNIPLYNYAYISEFKRYYYIEDISYEIGIWVIYLRCDVLASYKTDIMNSTQYVLRSASRYDTSIADSMYLIKSSSATGEYRKSAYTNAQYGDDYVRIKYANGTTGARKFFNVDFTSGCFIVGIVGNNTAGVTYYAFTNSGFQEFINTAMTFTPSDMTDFSAAAGNAIFNPIQYITSVRWYPINPPYTTATQSIKIGGYTLPTLTIGGYPMNVAEIVTIYLNIAIPKHPSSSRLPYLNLSPYSELNLYFQPFGCIPIDTTKVINASEITCTVAIDFCGGSCNFSVYESGSTIWDPSGLLYTISTDYGVQLPISSLMMDWKEGLAVSALSWLKNTFTTNKPSQDENAWSYLPEYARDKLRAGQSNTVELGNKAVDITASALGQISTVGSTGSFLAYMNNTPYLMGWFKSIADEDIARFGRPLHQRLNLDLLSGFCVCSNAHVDYTALNPTSDEQLVIEALLNSGVYLE